MSISVFDQIKQTTSSQFTFITKQKFKVETDENWSLCVGGPNEANLFLPKRWLDQIDGRMLVAWTTDTTTCLFPVTQ